MLQAAASVEWVPRVSLYANLKHFFSAQVQRNAETLRAWARARPQTFSCPWPLAPHSVVIVIIVGYTSAVHTLVDYSPPALVLECIALF